MSTPLDIICLSPPGFAGAGMVRASRGAGFQGGIALEHGELRSAKGLLETAAQAQVRWCISSPQQDRQLLSCVEEFHGRGLSRVILCDVEAASLNGLVKELQAKGVEVFVQVLDVDQARAAEGAGAEAIVVKGNESGGRVGEETSFILLQRVRSQSALPVWVRGGIGLNTAAACKVGGAAGVVLDWQLALCEESQLPEEVKARVSRMDGSETAILGQGCAFRYRAFTRAGETGFSELRDVEDRLSLDLCTDQKVLAKWHGEVERRVRGEGEASRVLLMGQDAAFAASLAKQFNSVAKISEAIRCESQRLARLAARQKSLRPGGPLSASHGTRYPILQGPMTRVSDVADFANAVATGGGLPFLALALLRGPQVDKLLEETEQKLAGKPWGVGILGFVPKELRDEQLAEVRKHPPPFAIIAGGRPDQALELEREGIATYLHVPSPGLLNMFLKNGARRVIFEGRECGGHVGPRSSFVLWESMIQVILEHLQATGDSGDAYHVVFAGGIHDARSAAMVAALSAALSERGVRVGVLIGTAYLFTHEAVRSGAIVEGFQTEAVKCNQTILLESGVGHATRCADTEFGRTFLDEKRRLIGEGKSKDEIREALERLNLGRLRIASKAIMRDDSFDGEKVRPAYVALDDGGQRREGMYMIGQVAALRDQTCTIEELHRDVSAGGVEALNEFAAPAAVGRGPRQSGPSDIAIIGMSCLLPKAADKGRFWENILNGVRCTDEVPADRWDSELYFTTDRRARDNCYSKWGGFIDPVAFDPTRYGMPPNSIPSVEPLQLLVLEAVRHALLDAGYMDKPFDRENTSVILGAGGGVGEHGLGYGFRSMALHYLTAAGTEVNEVHAMLERLNGKIPEWTEDSFAGLLMNVAAGRVANRFDLGGTNYTVDAACASSLAAVRLAVEELESGSSNMAIVGGADTMQSPFAYLCFSNTQALSPTGLSRPFDAAADGIVISEGIAIAVLKRLEDAVRDGDRVYAVIKGVGSSSDGKDKGLTAPRPAGQIRALERAYAKAGFTPDTVGLIEAHGTGTVVGDQSEVESLTRSLTQAGAAQQSCALGSVKSMLGHTKCTAGVAGLLKAALALHHKVLPPTIGVTQPNPKAKFELSPLYVNTEARPWLANGHGVPRRAGVSAFGFGGTNFHAVLEEFVPQNRHAASVSGITAEHADTPGRQEWPAELLIWRAGHPTEMLQSVEHVLDAVAQGAKPLVRDLAAALAREGTLRTDKRDVTLAVVAGTLDELTAKLATAKGILVRGVTAFDPSGIYFSIKTAFDGSGVAFLFPGQGSQSVNMLRELAVASPLVRAVFERADHTLRDRLGEALSTYVFPRPSFTDEERSANEKALTQTRIAQPALGAADAALLHLLGALGIEANFSGGHSYGEYVALYAAGVLSFDDLMRVSEARGRIIGQVGSTAGGTMAAVSGDEATVSAMIAGLGDVWCANFNTPHQTVISGTETGIEKALELCKARGVAARRIKVSCAFHSPLVKDAKAPFAKALDEAAFSAPRIPVYSNSTSQAHASGAASIKRQLIEHLVQPVRFADQVRAMHDAGARVFVEVGPGRVLSGLVEQTLKGRAFAAIALNAPSRDSITSLMHGLAQVAAAGVHFDVRPLTENRTTCVIELAKLLEQTRPAELPRTTWMISGAKSTPLHGATPVATTTNGDAANQYRDRKGATLAPVHRSTPSPSVAGGAPASPASVTSTQHTQASARRAPDSQVDSIMAAHQQLMARLLEAHKNVMLGLLGQGAASNPIAAGIAHSAESTTAIPPAQQMQMPTAAPVPLARAMKQAAIATTGSTNGSVLHAAPAEAVQSSATIVAPTVSAREKLTQALVTIVADRTGYPPDMLGLDMDLEADLGIDSIKRVEILGALQDGSTLPGQSVSGDMETLSQVKSLRGIVDWLCARMDGSESVPPAQNTPTNMPPIAATPSNLGGGVPRMTLKAVDHPLEIARATTAHSGAAIILDDEQGVASLVAEALRQSGVPVEVAHVVRGAEHNGRQPRVNLADPQVARQWCDHVRTKHGRIGTVIHLLPLANADLHRQDEPTRWVEPLETELHSLFNVAQAVEADLRKPGGRVLAIARLDGSFGSVAKSPAEFWPGAGGACGLVKTLAREWPETISRVVDVGRDATVKQISEIVLNELRSDDQAGEVGYSAGRRIALLPASVSLAHRSAQITLRSDSVILITGGARGITAEAAMELAQRFACKLVLVGRAALPAESESKETAGIGQTKQLKAILLKSLEKSDEKITPAKVEAAYARLLRERETRENLSAMRTAGSAVEYHAVDVSDADAFGTLIDDLYRRHGRIDGVIHGAGVIEDKLIRDKTLESFRRVCDPKIRGALTLAAKLRPETLKFLVFFSSVSGRYGNRGQADYAAANEVLDKLAISLNAKWNARVAALLWGPWESTGGMVSAELAKQFAKAGIHIISRREGKKAVVDEILLGHKDETEVLFGGPLDVSLPGKTIQSATHKAVVPTNDTPLLRVSAKATRQSDGRIEVVREVDPASDIYLSDHQLDGRPVMPMAMIQEHFAETASLVRPGWHVTHVRDLRVLRGISFEKGARTIRVTASPAVDAGSSAKIKLQAEIGESGQIFDTAEIEVRQQLPAPTSYTPLQLIDPRPLPLSVADAYEQWLFHGPIFAGIVEVEAVGDNGVIAQLAPSTPTRCLAQSPSGDWLIDPVMVDSALQLIILWARVYIDMTPLPARLTCYHRFAGPIREPVRCEAAVRHTAGTPIIHADFRFIDADGKLVGWLEGLEGTCSKALNRLAETRAGQVVDQK